MSRKFYLGIQTRRRRHRADEVRITTRPQLEILTGDSVHE